MTNVRRYGIALIVRIEVSLRKWVHS